MSEDVKYCPVMSDSDDIRWCAMRMCALWDTETCRCAIASLPLELRELNKTISWATGHLVQGLNR